MILFNCRFLYTIGTVMVAFSTSGESSQIKIRVNKYKYQHEHKCYSCYVLFFFSFSFLVLAILLFPALSLLAVGGILFLMTNMQVLDQFKITAAT